ncbi:MAG: hypothetical protein Cons2KO_04840 [Congregibacter sp.]
MAAQLRQVVALPTPRIDDQAFSRSMLDLGAGMHDFPLDTLAHEFANAPRDRREVSALKKSPSCSHHLSTIARVP